MVNKKLIETRIKNLDLSISAFERKAGLKRNVVQNILHGKSKQPTPNTLKALADLLDCSVDDLISSEAVPEKANSKRNRWDANLLINVIKTVTEEALTMNIKISCIEEILPIIKESYLFNLENNENNVDKKFIRWILKKNYIN